MTGAILFDIRGKECFSMFDGDYPIGPQGCSEANLASYRDWLAQMCLCVPHVKEGYGYFAPSVVENSGSTVLTCPEHLTTDKNILAALESATKTQEVVFEFFSRNEEELCAIVCPRVGTATHWVEASPALSAVALVFPKFEPSQLDALARLINNNFAWLHLMLGTDLVPLPQNHEGASFAQTKPSSEEAEILNNWLITSTASSCAAAIVNDLTRRLDCERTVLAKIEPGKVEILAISGLSNPDPRQRCNQACSELFESLAARGDGFHRSEKQTEPAFTSAFERYKLLSNTECVAVQIYTTSNATKYGLVFDSVLNEGTSSQKRLADIRLTDGLEILCLKRAAEPGRGGRLLNASKSFLQRCFGKGNLNSKLGLLAISILCIAATLIPFDFKVSAPITLEGSTQRAIVAPFESYIRAAHVEAGMTVRSGEPLVELDKTKLVLELDKWQSEKAKLGREYDRALAELNHAEAQILRAQLGQAEAELNLVNDKLARTVLYAPFDGVVISGNLGSSLGAPTARGELLLELAPLTGYRVVLGVDERDIGHVQTTQFGELTLNAMPGERWPFEIINVASAAPGEDGEHIFRVEAKLSKTSDQLRPGMQGLGKISVGEESLAYLLSRRLLGWLQLNTWAHLP